MGKYPIPRGFVREMIVRGSLTVIQVFNFLGVKCASPGKCMWCKRSWVIQIRDGVAKTGDRCKGKCDDGLVYRNPSKRQECVKCLSPRCKLLYFKSHK